MSTLALPPVLLTTGVSGADGLSCLSRSYVAALSEMYERIEVWSLTDGPETSWPDSRVRLVGAGGDRPRYAAMGLGEALRAQSGRAVIVLHAHLAPVALPLVLRGARLVHVLVGIEVWRPLSRLERAAVGRAHRLLSISRFTEEEFRKWNPSFARREIRVCHPGMPELPSADEGNSAPEPFALIVGRMARSERYKGHEPILRAWARLIDRRPEAKLLVVGDGDDRARLEDLSRELGLADAVRFTGRVSDTKLAQLYRRCAFFLMPSSKEGFGLVFLEAMRAGKAVIGGRGASAEIIENGKTGFVVSAEEPDQLERAIETLWADPRLRDALGRRGRERFVSRFTEASFRRRLSEALA